MRAFIVGVIVGITVLVPSARAQDAEDQVVEAPEAERAAPVVVQAWAVPDREVARTAAADEQESTAWAHIHDADAELLEREAAERMIGFDVMDGVR